jgi:hypothetical protein
MILSWPVWKALQSLFFEMLESVEYEELAGMVLFHDPNDCHGYMEPGIIWINTAHPLEDVLGTMWHEVCHLLQDPNRTDVEAYEQEANEFASKELVLWAKDRYHQILEEIDYDS